jgi:diguanylate cyclase (GGDEF)-like protein/PAS domain S-box-containing protein
VVQAIYITFGDTRQKYVKIPHGNIYSRATTFPAIAGSTSMTVLRVLMLEDAEADALAAQSVLSAAGIAHTCLRVNGAAAFTEALTSFDPDIVLTDFVLRELDGPSALAMARHHNPDLPVVFVTANNDIATAVECLKLGAMDYVFKSDLHRLPISVHGALDRTTGRAQRRRNTKSHFEASRRFEIFMENLPGLAAISDQAGRYIYANERLAVTFGETRENVIGQLRSAFLPEHFVADMERVDRRIVDTGIAEQTYQSIETSKGKRWWLVSKFPVRDEFEQATYIGSMSLDITERIAAEDALNLRDRAIQVCANPILIVDIEHPDMPLSYVNDAFVKETGYTREEVIGKNCRLLQGDDHDQPELTKIRDAILEQRTGSATLRNYRKDGSMFLNELHIAPVLDPLTGLVKHFVGMQQDVTQIKQYQADLERQANYDALTGLANRNLLHERLQQTLIQSKRYGRIFTVAFIDIDHFKRVNDGFGHDAGDTLIKAIGARLQSCMRDGDTVARRGGDEFVLLICEQLAPDNIFGIIQRVQAEIVKPLVIHDTELTVTCSIGLASYPLDGEDYESLLANADAAMYRAKTLGRNNFQFYAKEMNAHSEERLIYETDLRHAIDRSELLLHYQPQIDLRTGRVIGMESLIRWQHPVRGLVMPMNFIPVAEENGLIVPIGAWVLRTACQHNRRLQDEGFPVMRVAVNLSARQLRDKNLLGDIRAALAESGMDPRCLEIEITESMIMHNPEEAAQILRQIKELGCQLSLDDFGTGYSSLAYLKRFPVDRLKIDKSFVMNMAIDTEDAAIVRAIIALSHSLGIEVTAEGIENIDTLTALIDEQCDEAQGYHFSRPLTFEDMRTLLIRSALFPMPRNLLQRIEIASPDQYPFGLAR